MMTAITVGAFSLLILGFPIWVLFVIVTVGALYYYTTVPMTIVVQALYGSLDNFVLLAVPAFIFAGEVMGRGGMSKRLVDWISALMGRVPGGLALTTVGACEVFGAISGSSAATVAALGKVLYPGLREARYPEAFSLGLITSSGALASIIPPSINMILFAAMADASVGRLFLGGVVPGILIGLFVSTYCIWYTLKHGLHSHRRWDLRLIGRTTRDALWTLGAPGVIFGGIYGGLLTPTEAAMIVAVYSVLVTVVIYRELKWQELWAIAREACALTAKIFIIVAASGVFSWILAAENVPNTLIATVSAMSLSPWMVLAMINVLLLLAGMFIDPSSAIILLAPLLWPIAQGVGVDLTHFGIIMTVNLAIGMFTPPFGLNIFVSSSLFGVPSGRIVQGLVPFTIAYLIALIVVTYVPWFSLAIPNALFG